MWYRLQRALFSFVSIIQPQVCVFVVLYCRKPHAIDLIKELGLLNELYLELECSQKDVFLALQKNRNLLLTSKTILTRFELKTSHTPSQIETDKRTLIEQQRHYHHLIYFVFALIEFLN